MSGQRRRGGCLLFLLIVVAVVVGADFGGRWYVEQQMAQQVSTQVSSSTTPRVRIGGWSFIAQLIQRKFDDIELDVSDAKIGKAVAARSVLRLQGVPLAGDRLIAERVTGQITVAYNQFGDTKGAVITFAPPNRLKVSATSEFFGQRVPVVITAVPQLDTKQQTLTFGNPQLSFGQVEVPASVTQGLLQSQMKPRSLPVPKGLRAQGINATAAGVVMDFSGSNVVLQELR